MCSRAKENSRPIAAPICATRRADARRSIRAVCGLPEDELQASLARLVASELVFQNGTPPDAIYTFKHALVQDAAYTSLLRTTRQELHRRIAEALETLSPELIDSQP